MIGIYPEGRLTVSDGEGGAVRGRLLGGSGNEALGRIEAGGAEARTGGRHACLSAARGLGVG